MSKPAKPHIRRLDEKTNEPVLDHEYDGIEELDNPLPGWWLATFYLCVAFAAFYYGWQNIVAGGHVHEDAYRAEQARLDQKLADAEATAAKAFDPRQCRVDIGVFRVDADEIGAGFGELIDLGHEDRVGDHQMDVQRLARCPADGRDLVGEEQQGGRKMAVCDIDMEDVGERFDPGDIVGHVQQVGRP